MMENSNQQAKRLKPVCFVQFYVALALLMLYNDFPAFTGRRPWVLPYIISGIRGHHIRTSDIL